MEHQEPVQTESVQTESVQAKSTLTGSSPAEPVLIASDSAKPAPNPRRWMTLRIVVLITFMACLDSSIVNIALPILSVRLNEPISTIAWVVTSYLIVICVLGLFYGRLGDIKGNTLIFKFGIAVFTCGSLFCGISVNLIMLVIARVIQAVGAAATMATSQGILTQAFPPNERGRALGLNGTSVALGSLIGPPLGGFIVYALSWHFIFLINVPIGIIAFILALRALPKGNASNESLDLTGVFLFGLSTALIFCAVGSGQNVNFLNPFVISAILAGIVLFAVFILVERRQSQPMLDLSIFNNPLYTISVICAFLVFLSMSSINILQPFYLQNARGLHPFTAGLMMMTYPVILAVAAPLSGSLSDKIGQKLPTLIGLCFSTIGYVGAALMTVNTSLILTGLVYGLLGLGNAIFISPNTSLIMSSVPRHKLGVAGSINALNRNVGFVFGVLLATTVLFSSMSARYGQTVNTYVAGRPDLFIYGMRATYLAVTGICFLGVLLTATRFFAWEKLKKNTPGQ